MEPTNLETPKSEFKPLRGVTRKTLIIAIIIVALGALAFYYKHLLVAATVDGQIINRLSVIKKLEKQGGKSALDALIDDALISNAAKKAGINVTEEESNKKFESVKSQVEASGGTLEIALASAGLTLEELKKQILMQLKLEKLMEDKLTVTDEEINKYITDNQVAIPEGKDAEIKDQTKEQLRSAKFNNEVSKYLSDLRTAAKIRTYVEY